MNRMAKRLEYEVFAHKSVLHEAQTWCREHWGQRWEALSNQQGIWTVFWAGREQPGYYRWCFETEQQALFFSLRWQ